MDENVAEIKIYLEGLGYIFQEAGYRTPDYQFIRVDAPDDAWVVMSALERYKYSVMDKALGYVIENDSIPEVEHLKKLVAMQININWDN